MTVETDGRLPAYFRFYTSGANPNLTLIREGGASMSNGIYEIVIAENFRPSVAGNITGMRWGIGGHAAGVNFTVSNITICRVIEVPPADAPQFSADPTSLTFTPTDGVQTFLLSGKNLTSDAVLTAPRGFTVSPTSVSPCIHGYIMDEVITVEWTTGNTTPNIPVVISGGGVANPIQVALNAGVGFSSHCNATVTAPLGGFTDSRNNILLSKRWNEDRTQVRFYIKPYAEGHTPAWRLNSFNQGWQHSTDGGANWTGVASTRTPAVNVAPEAGDPIIITFATPLEDGDMIRFTNGVYMSWYNAGAGGGQRHFGGGDVQVFTVGCCDLLEAGPGTLHPEVPYSSVILFPNPVTDILHFTETVRAVNIFTVLGQRVLSEVNVNQVRVSHLPSGLYIVNAVDADGNQISAVIEVR